MTGQHDMTTDTSAEALTALADDLQYPTYYNGVKRLPLEQSAATLRALAAEKRRAREWVTMELARKVLKEWGWDTSSEEEVVDMRKALEAVWPDGRDAKDAARYRWLRDVADCDAEQPYVVVTKTGDWGKSHDHLLDGVYLDFAIDAAMKDTDHD